jgi:hypothetical protein
MRKYLQSLKIMDVEPLLESNSRVINTWRVIAPQIAIFIKLNKGENND